MPEISRFFGIVITTNYNDHPPPHFHAVFAEYRAQIDIRSLHVLRGSLPPAKLAVVISWAETRREALLSAWNAALANQKPEKIR